MQRRALLILACIFALVAPARLPAAEQARSRPNIVLIMADDSDDSGGKRSVFAEFCGDNGSFWNS